MEVLTTMTEKTTGLGQQRGKQKATRMKGCKMM